MCRLEGERGRFYVRFEVEARLDERFVRVGRLGRVCLRTVRRCPGTGYIGSLCLVLYRRETGACVWGGIWLETSRTSFWKVWRSLSWLTL